MKNMTNDELMQELLELRRKTKIGINYMQLTEAINDIIREIKNASTT